MSSDTFVKDHIQKLRDKVSAIDSTELLLHSAALGGAVDLTNGSRGNIEKISDQLALLTAVIVGDRLGEHDRHMARCPIMGIASKDKDGKLIMPPSREEIRNMFAAHGAQDKKAAESGFDLNLPFAKKVLTARGKAALVPAIILAIFGGLILYMFASNYINNKRFRTNVELLLSDVKQQEASTSRGAVVRSKKILDAVHDSKPTNAEERTDHNTDF